MQPSFKYVKIDHPDYKYQLIDNYSLVLNFKPEKRIKGEFYTFNKTGLLTIHDGYCWDGASGPTIDTENTMRASCVHDVLYQMIRLEQLPLACKDYADKELRRVMLEDGAYHIGLTKAWNYIRAGYFYYAVKVFGFSACTPHIDVILRTIQKEK